MGMNRVYCKKCAYCYQINDGCIRFDGSDYFCSNPSVAIVKEYEIKGTPLKEPVECQSRDTTCIHINQNNDCEGYKELQIIKKPIKIFGIHLFNKTISNKVTEDIGRSRSHNNIWIYTCYIKGKNI